MLEDKPVIEVIAVAFQRYGELKVFVQCWINQTERNWKLRVIHDGEDNEFLKIMNDFKSLEPERIDFECSKIRYNDRGCTLRDIGIKKSTGDFVLLTNSVNEKMDYQQKCQEFELTVFEILKFYHLEQLILLAIHR